MEVEEIEKMVQKTNKRGAEFGPVEIRSVEGKGPYYLQAQEKIKGVKAAVEILEALVAEMYDGKENMKSLPEENDRKLSSPKFLPFVPFISSLPDELMGLEDRIRSAINQIKKGM